MKIRELLILSGFKCLDILRLFAILEYLKSRVENEF